MPGRSRPEPRRRRARTLGAALATTLALLGTAACGGEPPAPPTVTTTPDPAVAKSAPPAPVVPEPPKPEPVVWPLTGERVGRANVPKRPAVAVKIENSPAARPHTGLHRADIVYEQLVEGGITRFVAVYHSTRPKTVGPIRSVRPMDPAIVAPLYGILAYTGGQPPFVRAVGRVGTQSVTMDGGDPGFWRSGSRAAPHDVYGSVRAFARQANASRDEPPRAQFRYAAKVGQGSASRNDRRGHVADVRFSPAQRTVWQWKAKQDAYARSDGSAPSMSSGRQVTARSVLVLSVDVHDTRYRDPAGTPVPTTRMVDRGKGVLLAGGRALNVDWSKGGPRQRIRLTTRQGDPVRLDPGNLWVELVPRDGGSWRVR